MEISPHNALGASKDISAAWPFLSGQQLGLLSLLG